MSEIIDIQTREIKQQYDATLVGQTKPCERVAQPELPKPSFYQRAKRKVRRSFRYLKKMMKICIRVVAHAYRRHRTPALLGKLSKLCQELNDQDNFTIFINLHGGCDSISLNVYPLGYSCEDEEKFSIDILSGALPGYTKYSRMRLKDIHNTMLTLRQLSATFKCLRDNMKTMQQYNRKIIRVK